MKICHDCKRHVRSVDVSCPFCGAGVPVVTALALAVSLGLASGVTGCGPVVDTGISVGQGESSGAVTGTTGDTTTSGPSMTTAPWPVTTGTTRDDTTSAGSTTFGTSTGGTEESTGVGRFISEPDGGGTVYGIECSVWAQNCGPGEKCVPWSNDGTDSWNATICRPIDPAGGSIGDPCVVEGSAVTGADNCDATSYCFDVDPETLEGTCFGFCQGPEDDPSCANPSQTCIIENEGALTLCLDPCDPLGGGCVDGRSCVAVRPGTFVCVPPGDSAVGEPCTQFNDCSTGVSCNLPDDFDGTCTSPCDPVAPLCDPGSICQPWGEAGLCVPDKP